MRCNSPHAIGQIRDSSRIALARLLNPDFNFREKNELHGTLAWVDISNFDLGSTKSWPLILDEAVRLLSVDGTSKLSFRSTESSFLSMARLAEFLFLRPDLILVEHVRKRLGPRSFQWEIQVIRKSVSPKRTLEIGVVSNGEKPETLRSCIDSAKSLLADNSNLSISICGPSSRLLSSDLDLSGVRIIDFEDQTARANQIAAKKNKIVRSSDASILLIIHERYVIDPLFLNSLDSFGYDFDLAVPSQSLYQNKIFPGLAAKTATSGRSRSIAIRPGRFRENWYINGGAILARTEVLRDFPWNELLEWNEEEDVELSRRLAAGGFVPRQCSGSMLWTTEPHPGYVRGFKSFPVELSYGIGRIPNHVRNLFRERARYFN